MYRDFARSIRDDRAREMSLERAIDDQRLMDQIYATIGTPGDGHTIPDQAAGRIGP
jgi:hypothetical protein